MRRHSARTWFHPFLRPVRGQHPDAAPPPRFDRGGAVLLTLGRHAPPPGSCERASRPGRFQEVLRYTQDTQRRALLTCGFERHADPLHHRGKDRAQPVRNRRPADPSGLRYLTDRKGNIVRAEDVWRQPPPNYAGTSVRTDRTGRRQGCKSSDPQFNKEEGQ